MKRQDKRIFNKGFKKLAKKMKRMSEDEIAKTLLNLVESTYDTDKLYFKNILMNTYGVGPILYDRIVNQLGGEEECEGENS